MFEDANRSPEGARFNSRGQSAASPPVRARVLTSPERAKYEIGFRPFRACRYLCLRPRALPSAIESRPFRASVRVFNQLLHLTIAFHRLPLLLKPICPRL